MRIRRYIIYIIGIVLSLVGCLTISLLIYFYPLISETIESSRVVQIRQTELPGAEIRFRQVKEDIGGLLASSTVLQIRTDEIRIWHDLPHCIKGTFEVVYGSPQSYEEIIKAYSEVLTERQGWGHSSFNLGRVDGDLNIEPIHNFSTLDSSLSVNIHWLSPEPTSSREDFRGKYTTYYLLLLYYTDKTCIEQ